MALYSHLRGIFIAISAFAFVDIVAFNANFSRVVGCQLGVKEKLF